jgi:Ca-activated chloride channel family protein
MRFEHPQVLWLAAAAIPALIGFLFWSWRVKQKLILQFVHARLLPSLTSGVSPAREKVRLALLVAAVAGILFALARPQWGFAWEEATQKGLDIMVAMDTSRSMLARDVLPNRLEKSKLAVIDLMRLAKSDRLGLVVFAGNAFLQAPLTLDEQAFQQAVDAVSVGIVPVGGTSLSSAIRTSLDAFDKGNDNHKVLVLFTDGEDHDVDTDTMAAVKEAVAAGMRIFTIGVGTPEGEMLRTTDEQGNAAFVKDENGDAVKSHLNQTLLQQIATEASGFYLPLLGANPMETLYTRGLEPLPKSEESTRLTRVYRERYHWFLSFAMICLILEALLPESSRPRARSRRARAAAPPLQKVAAALVLLLIPWSIHGSPSSAFREYQSGDFKGSFDEYNRLAGQKTNDYRLHYDAGTAAYKAKELEKAQAQFNAALNTPDIIADPQNQQRAYYNLGNTLYQMGEPLPEPDKKKELWQQAIENYGRAVRLNTNDIDARNNLAYVKQKLEELKQQQQKQQQNKDKDQQDKKDQKDQDKQDQQNQQQQKQQDNKDQKDQKQQQQDQKQQKQQDQKSDQQKKDEQKARQEQAKKDQEKKNQEKKQQQAQANKAEQKDKDKQDENAEPTPAAELRMSPQEARKLLEAMKDDAKVLLFSPTNQPINAQRGKFKDW